MSTASPAAEPVRGLDGAAVVRWLRRNAWVIGLFALLGVMLLYTRFIQPSYGASGIESLAKAGLPIAFAA